MNSKLKILQVIDMLNIGGAERVCTMLCNMLNEAEHSVAMLLLVGNGKMISSLNKTIPLVKLNRRNKFNLITMYKCAKIIRDYEIIHIHMRHNFRYIRLVQRLFLVKSKLILHDHYGNIDRDFSVPFGLNFILKPTYYIGVSETLTEWAHKYLKIPHDNIFVLKNTITKEIVKKDNIAKKGLVLVGNIKPIKNQYFAIQLMNHLDSTLTICGGIHDKNYYKLLVDLITELKIKNKIFFKHDVTNIQQELHYYELGLQTAESESGPLVLIEYLAQSLPFLSYNTGQVVEDIKNDLPDLIMDNFDIDNWIKSIAEFKNIDTELLVQVYEKYYGKKKYLANCEAIYNVVMEC